MNQCDSIAIGFAGETWTCELTAGHKGDHIETWVDRDGRKVTSLRWSGDESWAYTEGPVGGVSDITWRDAYDTRAEYEQDMAEQDAYWRPLYEAERGESSPVDAYEPDDPKRLALDPYFDPDFVRDLMADEG